MKRFFIVALAVLMLSTSAQTTFAADDITNHWAENDIRTLVSKGIMDGYGGGSYQPEKAVSRAEFAKLIVESLGLATSTNHTNLTDINKGDWFYPWVSSAVQAGIINGYPDKTFQPDKEISRQEMATMLVRSLALKDIFLVEAQLSFKDNAEIIPGFKKDIQRVLSRQLMNGHDDNTFEPTGSATRAESATVLVRMLNILSVPKNYSVGTIDSNGNFTSVSNYPSYESAKSSTGSNQVVLEGNRVVYMKSGIVAASPYLNATTNIYKDRFLSGSSRTYVSSGHRTGIP